MLKRIPVSAVLAGLALTGALSACASAVQPSAASHSVSAAASTPASTSPSTSPIASPTGTTSTSPVHVAPIIFAVKLGRTFAPTTLRLSPGQQFEVIVESSVKASVLGVSSACTGKTNGSNNTMLTVHCSSGSYYYTAERAGTTQLTATVRPNCAKGSMCPQWVSIATLKITIV